MSIISWIWPSSARSLLRPDIAGRLCRQQPEPQRTDRQADPNQTLALGEELHFVVSDTSIRADSSFISPRRDMATTIRARFSERHHDHDYDRIATTGARRDGPGQDFSQFLPGQFHRNWRLHRKSIESLFSPPRAEMTPEPDRLSTTSQPDDTICLPHAHQPRPGRDRIGAVDLLLLSACGGLFAGLLEVAARVSCRAIDPSQRIYLLSRHFLWLGPLANLVFFLVLGLFLSAAVRLSPRAAGWLAPRLIGACALFPVLVALGPQIYAEAWMLLALGVAFRLVPILERRITSLRRKLLWGMPVMFGLVIPLAAFVFVGDWLKQANEAGRPMPPPIRPTFC